MDDNKRINHINSNNETPVIHLRNDENQLISDSQQVCGILNEYFVNIGPKMASSIPNLDTEKINNTFETNRLNSFLAPATSEEIASVIRSLKDKKSIRLEDVDTKFLKFSTNLIAPILAIYIIPVLKQVNFRTA